MRTDKHAFFLTTHAEIQITVEKPQHSIVFRAFGEIVLTKRLPETAALDRNHLRAK